ncbi:TniQ family protein [Neobacillus sp. YIM B06451]|uniref:TniQ family protein n=1 Tax=Neobacillus sp. YIM B06451 TaxID=3070994 RepID=UPI00292EFD06|nr:TniQ family protein [Neobacillus sp. YIM B06451]
MRLLKQTYPKDGESLYSFLHRLALTNYYHHLGSIFRDIGYSAYESSYSYIKNNSPWGNYLIEFLNSNGHNIDELILNQFDSLLVANGVGGTEEGLQSHRVYNRLYTKYCPHCFKDDFYHRLHWEITLLPVCSKHTCYLIERCPNCKNKITMGRLMTDKCSCGEVFSEANTEQAHKKVMTVQNKLHSLITGKSHYIKRSLGDKLDVEEFFQLFFLFCHLIDGLDAKQFSHSSAFKDVSKFNFSFKYKIKRSVKMMAFQTFVAYQLVVNPEKELGKVFETIKNVYVERTEPYHTKYGYIKKIFNHLKGKPYLEIFSNVMNDSKDVYVNRITRVKFNKENKRYITMGEAIHLINSEHATLLNLCNKGMIKFSQTERHGKHYTLIERKSVIEYLEMKKRCLTHFQATKILGLTFHALNAFIKKGSLVPKHGPGFDGYDLWYFEKDDLNLFLESITSKASRIPSRTNEWITLKDAVYKVRYLELGVTDLLLKVKEGNLSAAILSSITSPTCRDLLISFKDLNKLREDNLNERINTRGYKPKELRKVFKVGQYTIEDWIHDEILTISHYEKNDNDSVTRYVDKNQIIHLLRKSKGISKRDAIKYLEGLQLLPK